MKWKLGVGDSMILSGGVGGERSRSGPDFLQRLKRWMSRVDQRRGVGKVNLL
jgi:hypothetical protein